MAYVLIITLSELNWNVMEHAEQSKTSVTCVFSVRMLNTTYTYHTITWRKKVEVVLLVNIGQTDQNNKSKE